MDGTPWNARLVIPAGETADIETIPDTTKRLTFFAKGTPEAQQALLGEVNAQNLGVIPILLEND